MEIAIAALKEKLSKLHDEENEQADELTMAQETAAALERRRPVRLSEVRALEEAITKLGGTFQVFKPAL